jgi:hypothetical protein
MELGHMETSVEMERALDRIPEELFVAVSEFLRDGQGSRNADLRSAALVCKKWNRIVSPVLYRDAFLCNSHRNIQEVRQQAQSFLRTLVQQPELASRVQGLTSYYWCPYLPFTPPDSTLDTTGDVTACLRSTHLHHELRDALECGSQDAAVALALCYMAKLTSLEFVADCLKENSRNTATWNDRYDHSSSLTVRLIELAGTPFQMPNGQVLLGNLTRVVLSSLLSPPGWDVRLLSVFMRIPSLRELYASECATHLHSQGWACPDGLSNVRKIGAGKCTC